MSSPYHAHLRRALRYIEDNLTGDVSLDACAKAAGYSLYHFHRIFRMVLGMPPGEYERRRRLAVAAELIADSKMNLDRVAEASGFSCKEVLIRGFRREYGMSPASFRRGQVGMGPMLGKSAPPPDSGTGEVPLVPSLVVLPPMTLVGYEVTVQKSSSCGTAITQNSCARRFPILRRAPKSTMSGCAPVIPVRQPTWSEGRWNAFMNASAGAFPGRFPGGGMRSSPRNRRPGTHSLQPCGGRGIGS